MNQYFTKTLCEDFPELYQQRASSWLRGSFDCGDGWEPIIRELSQQLEFLNENANVFVEAVQVKEKFGGLRFYVTVYTDSKWWSNIVYSLIDAAEARSYYTCELCGLHGKLRKGGWIRTLCDECAEKR